MSSKVDIALVTHLLSILRRLGGPGLEEHALVVELEVAASRPLATAASQDVLLYCRDRGWINSRIDDFGRTIWWITESGITRLAGM